MKTTAWTIGDIHGIGPEIILKTFDESLRSTGQPEEKPIVIGSAEALLYYSKRLGLSIDIRTIDAPEKAAAYPQGVLPVISVGEPSSPLQPGTISAEAGRLSMLAIEKAANLCLEGRCAAMVTAPIHKEAVARAGYPHTGHTDFLADLCATDNPTMLFRDPVSGLMVALATIHVALHRVPELIRSMDISAFFSNLNRSLQSDFRIEQPRIAVLGLNPHASDGGVMGREEEEIILPCIDALTDRQNIEGPFAADGFFGSGKYRNYDVTVAMYHDQGLLPFKVLAFDTGINVTLGLPLVRTSPDHGTSFDIAGQGRASHRSFSEAAKLAGEIAFNRLMEHS